jgi:predicted ATPase
MPEQPSGTVTLVFTDVEGSTRLLAELGQDGFREAAAEHRRDVREAFAGGYEVDQEGDSFFYVFRTAPEAIAAVTAAMAALRGGPIRIRVGIHTGEPGLDPPKYVGLDVHRAARIMAAGHGGQVVVGRSTRELLGPDAGLRDLGEHRLKDFAEPERLYQLGEGVFPPLRTLMTTTLPEPPTAFIGRERELAEIVELVCGPAGLVTLTGPGGTGKTRLALAAAGEATDRFPDGLWWVPLASLHDPALLPAVIAQAVHVDEQAGIPAVETLVERLAGKAMLVVLDNLEQLLPGATGMLARLRDVPGPTLLVTSRERLQLEGEHVYAVPVLARTDGLALFGARSRAAGAEVEDSASVAELCARLDNLPLALELAAARTPLFSVEQLLTRLGERLDLLRGARDGEPRHASLRATLAWSYGLLDEREQQLFERLGVFAGGWTIEAAEAVAGAGVDDLQSLFDKSLIRRREERFFMLETIRELAAEKVGESAHRALASFLLALTRRAASELEGPRQAEWFEVLEPELDNVRAVLAWARTNAENEIVLELSSNLAYFWLVRGYLAEGRAALNDALARSSDPSLHRVNVLHVSGFLADLTGRHQQARTQLEEGIALAAELGAEGQRLRLAITLAAVLTSEGNLEPGAALLESELPNAREAGGAPLCTALVNLSDIVLRQQDLPRAASLAEEAVAACRTSGSHRGRAMALGNLGLARLAEGNVDEARRQTRACLELYRELGGPEGMASALSTLGAVAVAAGDADTGALLLAKSEAMFRELGITITGAERAAHERALAGLERRDEAGAALTTAEALALALGYG